MSSLVWVACVCIPKLWKHPEALKIRYWLSNVNEIKLMEVNGSLKGEELKYEEKLEQMDGIHGIGKIFNTLGQIE